MQATSRRRTNPPVLLTANSHSRKRTSGIEATPKCFAVLGNVSNNDRKTLSTSELKAMPPHTSVRSPAGLTAPTSNPRTTNQIAWPMQSRTQPVNILYEHQHTTSHQIPSKVFMQARPRRTNRSAQLRREDDIWLTSLLLGQAHDEQDFRFRAAELYDLRSPVVLTFTLWA